MYDSLRRQSTQAAEPLIVDWLYVLDEKSALGRKRDECRIGGASYELALLKPCLDHVSLASK